MDGANKTHAIEAKSDLDETIGYVEKKTEATEKCDTVNCKPCEECMKKAEEYNILQKQIAILQEELKKKCLTIEKQQKEIAKKKVDNKTKEKILRQTVESHKQIETNYNTLKAENHRISVECTMAKESLIILRERLEEEKETGTGQTEEALNLIKEITERKQVEKQEMKSTGKNLDRSQSQNKEKEDFHEKEKCHSPEEKISEVNKFRDGNSVNTQEKRNQENKKKEEKTSEENKFRNNISVDTQEKRNHQEKLTSKDEGTYSAQEMKNNDKPVRDVNRRGEMKEKNGDKCSEIKVTVPREKIGFIIGKGGWKTRSIQTATDTVIIHPQDETSNEFTIIGKDQDTDQARRIITNMVAQSIEENHRESRRIIDLEESQERVSYDQPRKCRYYLRGYCKFGERCKFQHGLNEDRPRTNNRYSDTSREYNYRTNRNHNVNLNRRRWEEYKNRHDQNSTWGRSGTNYDTEREIKRSFGNRGQWVKEDQGYEKKVKRHQNTGNRYQQNRRQWDEVSYN